MADSDYWYFKSLVKNYPGWQYQKNYEGDPDDGPWGGPEADAAKHQGLPMQKISKNTLADTTYERLHPTGPEVRRVGTFPTHLVGARNERGRLVGGKHEFLEATPRSAVFHYSRLQPAQFLKNPMLHVGSVEQGVESMRSFNLSLDAKNKNWDPEKIEGTHKFTFSPDAEFFTGLPKVSDEVANRAHANVLKEQGDRVSRNISGIWDDEPTETVVKEHVRMVTDALKSGQIVPYTNLHEMANVDDFQDKNAMSYIVPNPKKNLRRG